ncbi:MAG: hypothetical protein JSS63_05040 [Bacteroidetes bacterium]|nr:hypothetical protein [Bacteroidota bacterium]
MKLVKILLCLFCMSISAKSFAQQDTSCNKIRKIYDGMYFMYFDSSNSKSTIIEFSDFLFLLEAPIIDLGGGAKELKDDIAGGEKILRTLKANFPNKPLKYFAHSHWHPHSISSVSPFLNNNVSLITTEENFKVIKTFADSNVISKNAEKIIFVPGDSLRIADSFNEVIIYRFDQKNFPSTPTKDYLYCYFPKYNCMHAACMYTKWMGEPVDGKQLLSGREENLYNFLKLRNIKPDFLIRLSHEKKEDNDMQPYEGLQNVNLNGIKSADIMDKYLSISSGVLKNTRDEIIRVAINKNIPTSIFNSCVYTELRKKEFERALDFAIIQAQVNPSDPNSWDTLGEVYYFLGEYAIAKNYLKHKKKMFPEVSTGGEEVWQKDLENFQKVWDKNK